MYHLSEESLKNAIKHLCLHGDTDVFPYLPELHFLRESESEVIAKLKTVDLDSYDPGSAVEALAPKSRYGFRIVHQLPVLDTILLLASTIELGEKIENHRLPQNELWVCSYRFSIDEKGNLFHSDRRYKDWLRAQQLHIQGALKIKQVIVTDISDFYARINFHRLENLLDEVAPKHGAAKYIKKHIKTIRMKQSFGLPVGGSAARLLSELALSDTDHALKDHGLKFTRFVDDFRIFLKANENPYDALAILAEQLALNEGLALNVAKTRILSREEFLNYLDTLSTEISDEAEGHALDELAKDTYFDDDPDPEKLEELKKMNLLGFLQQEAGKESFDVGRIKVIFRALKVAKPFEAVDYIKENLSELVVFAKEVSLLMQHLEKEYPGCFNKLADEILETIVSPPASSIQLLRTWLLELFVKGTVPISLQKLKKLESLTSPLDKRQIYLIRGRLGDKSYFRKNKTAFGHISAIEQMCFIWGASCLPEDEYETWLKTIKPMFSSPLAELFRKWVVGQKSSLVSKLDLGASDSD